MGTRAKIFQKRRDLTLLQLGNASRAGVVSDGLRCGQKQVAEKVSQQVDTSGELGSNRSCWLETSFV